MISYRESLLTAFGENKGLGFNSEVFRQNGIAIGYASERECALYLNRDIILEHPLWRNVNLKSGRIFVPEGVRECAYVDSRGRAGSEGAGGVQAEGVMESSADVKLQQRINAMYEAEKTQPALKTYMRHASVLSAKGRFFIYQGVDLHVLGQSDGTLRICKWNDGTRTNGNTIFAPGMWTTFSEWTAVVDVEKE